VKTENKLKSHEEEEVELALLDDLDNRFHKTSIITPPKRSVWPREFDDTAFKQGFQNEMF
jgi:hypothetical protein